MNCNVAFTVREQSEKVPIVTTANTASSVDILELAGSTHVLQLGDIMGRALARHSISTDARAHLLGRFGEVCIAEATAAGTPLAGKTLAEIDTRALAGLTIAGLWKRGAFEVPRPDSRIDATSVLLLAGTAEQLESYNELFCIYHNAGAPVVIIGGGRVGRAAGKVPRAGRRRVSHRRGARRPRARSRALRHRATPPRLEVLERAGLRETPTVIITPHEDDTNIYLTLYCRKLRPDVQIIARASLEKNVSTLHRAGADFVMSYASMGANSIFNQLKSSDVTIVAEGLSVFPAPVPDSLVGTSLAGSALPRAHGLQRARDSDGRGRRRSIPHPINRFPRARNSSSSAATSIATASSACTRRARRAREPRGRDASIVSAGRSGRLEKAPILLETFLQSFPKCGVRIGGAFVGHGGVHQRDHAARRHPRRRTPARWSRRGRSCGSCRARRRARRCGSRRADRRWLRRCRRSSGSAGAGAWRRSRLWSSAAVAASSKMLVLSPTRMIGPSPILPGAGAFLRAAFERDDGHVLRHAPGFRELDGADEADLLGAREEAVNRGLGLGAVEFLEEREDGDAADEIVARARVNAPVAAPRTPADPTSRTRRSRASAAASRDTLSGTPPRNSSPT